MLVFVIPVKSVRASRSWSRVSELFDRCVRSVCNQTSSHFRAIVVCHEKPVNALEHPHLEYLEVDFSVNLTGSYQDIYIAKNTDKGRKILAGIDRARKYSPSHVMVVDMDDCVSHHVADFVYKNQHKNGWFVNRGYKYLDGDQFLYLKHRNFYKMCGTANIIRYPLLNVPDVPEYNRGYGYYKFYIDHAKIRDHLGQQGTPLEPLPFAGAIYVLKTGENNTSNEHRLSFPWFSRKRLNPSLCHEFGLPIVR